jgi:FkbM family methyltransferase
MRRASRTITFRYPPPIGEIRLVVRDNAADAFIHGEVFEHHYYRLPLVTPPKTILDLGANTGMTAVYFARTYPDAQIACLEPIDRNIDVLRSNLELNAVKACVFPAAIDTSDGSLHMVLTDKDYGHHVASDVSGERTVEVEALSVPTVMERLGWNRIDLLKVDIEGHEKALFASECDWLRHCEAACIECHEGFGEPDLVELAAKYGFAPPIRLPGIWLLRRGEAA